MNLNEHELSLVQFALSDYIKNFVKQTELTEFKREYITLFLKINKYKSENNQSHYAEAFKEIGMSGIEVRNYYAGF